MITTTAQALSVPAGPAPYERSNQHGQSTGGRASPLPGTGSALPAGHGQEDRLRPAVRIAKAHLLGPIDQDVIIESLVAAGVQAGYTQWEAEHKALSEWTGLAWPEDAFLVGGPQC